EDVRSAVHHLRLTVELGRRVHVTGDPHAPHDAIEIVVHGDAQLGDDVQGTEPGCELSFLDLELLPELSDKAALTIPLRELTGDEHEVACSHERHVVRARRRGLRQFKPKLREPLVRPVRTHRATWAVTRRFERRFGWLTSTWS